MTVRRRVLITLTALLVVASTGLWIGRQAWTEASA